MHPYGSHRQRESEQETTGPRLGSIPGVGGGAALRLDRGRGAVPARPSRRARPLLLVVAMLVLPAVTAATLVDGRDDHGQAGVQAAQVRPSGDRPAAAVPAAPPPVFATYEDLALHLPDEEALLVGFHEASYDDALAFAPVGEVLANENRTKFTAPPATADQPEYVVLSSRGRARPATSATDIVLPDDVPVRSLVTGTVTEVRPYALYGKYPDTRIEIRPDDRPDLRVVLIHVTGVAVRAGEHVEAGVTRLAAGANRFPFASHIDRYLEPDRWPHVHVEVKRP